MLGKRAAAVVVLGVAALNLVFGQGADAARSSGNDNLKRSYHDTKVMLEENCRLVPRKIDLGAAGQRLNPSLVQPLASLASSFVTAGVNAFTGHLKKIREEFSEDDYAIGSGLFFAKRDSDGSVVPANYCLTLVRGEFGVAKRAVTGDWARPVFDDLHLASIPDLYAEFHIDYLGYPGAFQIRPVFLEYRKPGTKRSSSKNEKYLGLQFVFASIGRSGDDAAGEKREYTRLTLPPMKIGFPARLDIRALDHLTTGYEPAPSPVFRGSEEDQACEVGCPDPDRFDPVPVTVIVDIVESENPTVLSVMMEDFAIQLENKFRGDLAASVEEIIRDRLADDRQK